MLRVLFTLIDPGPCFFAALLSELILSFVSKQVYIEQTWPWGVVQNIAFNTLFDEQPTITLLLRGATCCPGIQLGGGRVQGVLPAAGGGYLPVYKGGYLQLVEGTYLYTRGVTCS